MKIYVTGVSGTGKTSIARALIEQGVAAVDIDDISHWEHLESGESVGWEPGATDDWYKSNAWLCDIEALKKVLNSAENAVAIGHSTNQEEYLKLFDKLFILTCSPEIILSRIKQRTDNDFGKHPDDEKRILNWQKTFDDEMVAKGAVRLNAEQPLAGVVAEIRTYFN